MTIALLAEKLKELNENKEILDNLYVDPTDGSTYISTEHIPDSSVDTYRLLDEIELLACGLLITDEGQNNYRTSRELKDLSYPVVRGEYDSFGWLTGVIILPNFNYVYG